MNKFLHEPNGGYVTGGGGENLGNVVDPRDMLKTIKQSKYH